MILPQLLHEPFALLIHLLNDEATTISGSGLKLAIDIIKSSRLIKYKQICQLKQTQECMNLNEKLRLNLSLSSNDGRQ